MTTTPSTEGKQFKSSVLSMFIFIVVLGAPALLCAAVAVCSRRSHEIGLPFDLDSILPVFAGMLVFHAILSPIGAWMLSNLCPTTIFADGVTTQSFMGDERLVRWQDIARARTLRFLNLKWILVYPAGERKAIQVPLFQPRKTEVIQEI